MGSLMSTVKANDLQTTTGGIPTVKGQNLIPTAWVNFNGSGAVSIRDSENVSSITDAGTGQYKVNFASNMLNTNYSVSGSAGHPNSRDCVLMAPMTVKSISQVGCRAGGSNNVDAVYDATEMSILIMGGQA